MYRLVASVFTFAVTLAVCPPAQAEDLAAQLDAVAPHINSEDLPALGGPEDAAGILAGLDGQWFTLNNTVRNWGSAGAGFGPDDLEASRARTCSNEWESRLTYEVTGPSVFAIHELLRTHNAELTQIASLIEGRRFSISVDKEALMVSYGLDETDKEQRAQMQEMTQLLANEGVELWRPTDDILVSVSPFGVDITGRCPSAD